MKQKNCDVDLATTIINRLPLFNAFTATEKRFLALFHNHFIAYKKGDHIITENETDSYFFILLSGQAVVTKKDVSRPIAKLDPGDFFGELSFLTQRARTATVSAEEDALVMRIDRVVLSRLDPPIREKLKDMIIEKLMDRICRTNDMLKEIPS